MLIITACVCKCDFVYLVVHTFSGGASCVA